MIRPIRTYTDDFLRRHRDTHRKHPEFGTHNHSYLMSTIERVAAMVRATGTPVTLLDYGCGKGVFLDGLRRGGPFDELAGFDPAIEEFRGRPTRPVAVVTCLDVLDQLEERFVVPVIEDVAQLTEHYAIFSIITRQSPRFAHLRPRSALSWTPLVERHLRVVTTEIRTANAWEIAHEGACPERVIIVARPA